MAFVARQLSFKFQLGQGSFGGSGFDTVDVAPGLWATARIDKYASPSMNRADVAIAGLRLDLMNQLSRVGLNPAAVRDNLISVMAADAENASQPTTVFTGGIQEAWPDFSNPAEPVFRVSAHTGQFNAMRTVKPASYAQQTDVVKIMQDLAGQMGYTLENNGVSGKTISNPYLPGSPRSQAISAAEAAGIYVYFEDDKGVMAICPIDGSRNTQVPQITPANGLVGYPSFAGPGMINFVCMFNPLLRFLGNVEIANSLIQGANGKWRVLSLVHDLSTQPGGPWFSQVRGENITKNGS